MPRLQEWIALIALGGFIPGCGDDTAIGDTTRSTQAQEEERATPLVRPYDPRIVLRDGGLHIPAIHLPALPALTEPPAVDPAANDTPPVVAPGTLVAEADAGVPIEAPSDAPDAGIAESETPPTRPTTTPALPGPGELIVTLEDDGTCVVRYAAKTWRLQPGGDAEVQGVMVARDGQCLPGKYTYARR